MTGVPEPENEQAVQQHFMVTAASVSNRNLTPFFEEWGLPIDDATRLELARFPEVKVPIWNNLDRSTDIIERNVSPLEVPGILTVPADGVSFDVNHTPVYRGRGTPGATITIEQGKRAGAWYPVGTTTIDDFGDWSFTGLKLPTGAREARATQSKGGAGYAKNLFTVMDVVARSVTLTFPAGGVSFDVDHAPLYRGRGTPGATIIIEQGRLTGGWYPVGETLVDTNGEWAFAGPKLPTGKREARATQRSDGSVFRGSAFTVVESAMIPVTLTSPAEGSRFDVNHEPVYRGSGTPGATITIEQKGLTGGWYPVGTATVNDSGDWSCIGQKLPADEREARAIQSSDGAISQKNTFTVVEEVEVPVTLISPAEGASFDESHFPVYAGRGTPGALIVIEQGTKGGDWKTVGLTTVNESGDWSHTGGRLAAGNRVARASQFIKGVSSFSKISFTVLSIDGFEGGTPSLNPVEE